MAITISASSDTEQTTVSFTIVSNSISYAPGDLIVALFCGEDFTTTGGASISNSGTALTWIGLGGSNQDGGCLIAGWYAKPNASSSTVVTITTVSNKRSKLCVRGLSGADTLVFPIGVWSGLQATSVSLALTPRSSGSALFAMLGDWAQTNSFAGGASCSILTTTNAAGSFTAALLAPTTNPLTSASAFTLAETHTGNAVAWLAVEVPAPQTPINQPNRMT